jgi:hypothetical protein
MSKEHKGIYNGKKYITIKAPIQNNCSECVFDLDPIGCASMNKVCLPTHNEDGLYRNWVEDISGQKKLKSETPSKNKKYVTKVIDGFPCKILLPSKEANHVWVVETYDDTNGWMPLTLKTTREDARNDAKDLRSGLPSRIRKYIPVK